MYRILICFAIVFCTQTAPVTKVMGQTDKENDLRLWNDKQGNEITARFLRYREGVVYLRTNNRTTVQVRPSNLAKKDQDYIIKLLKDQKKEKLAEEFERLTQSSQTGKSNPSNGGRRGPVSSGGTNSGSADSSESLGDEPQASGSGAAVPGGKGGGKGGFTRGGGRVPMSRPPGTTPAGDGPVVFGGDPNRTPSPYTRTPDGESMELDQNPQGDPPKKGGGGIDPFAESELHRPDLSKGTPSSSSEYLGDDSKKERTPGSSSNTSSKENSIDPFAEMNPIDATSDFDDSNSKVVNNPFETNSSGDGGYSPPVVVNKSDDTAAKASDNSAVVAPSGMSSQSIIMIAIGVVTLLILVMIALLVMVLVKGKQPKPKRSYF